MGEALPRGVGTPESRVAEVRVGIVPAPFPAPFAAGSWLFDAIYNVVAAVRSASGTWGFGYAYDFDNAGAQSLVQAVKALSGEVCSSDALDTEHLHATLMVKSNFAGSTGVYLSAIGALDLALWDLKGKLLGTPVHALLGSTRTRIPAYAGGGPYNQPLAVVEREIKGYVDEGFRAVKIKLSPNLREARARIAACRSWVGDDVKMMFDFNQSLTLKDAMVAATYAAEQGAYWVEEPLPAWDLRGHAEIRSRVNCRIALGETLYGERGFYEAVRLGAADVLMPDLHKIGGITGWVAIRGLTNAAGVPLSSHIMSELSAHVMSATRGADLLEYAQQSKPLYANPFKTEGGCLVIAPDAPGFGLDPSRRVLDALEL